MLLAKKEIKIYKTNPKIDKYIYIYRVFENRVLGGIFGAKRDEGNRGVEKTT